MNLTDFSALVRNLQDKVSKPELTHMFYHFDKGRKNFITKQDFIKAFQTEV